MNGLRQKLLEEERFLKDILNGIGDSEEEVLEGTLRISMDKIKSVTFIIFQVEMVRNMTPIFQRLTKNFLFNWRKIHITTNCAAW